MSNLNRAELLAACALVRPALATQAYVPALTHVLFTNSTAMAYNDISAIRVKAPGDLERCVLGDVLIRALGSFSGDEVAVQEGKDGNLVIKSGRSTIKVPALPRRDFPFKMPQDDVDGIVFDADLLRGVTRCLLSVGNDPTHPASMGITLDVQDDRTAVLYSTDNLTISRYSSETKIKLPGGAPVIMPKFFCEQLVGLSKAFPEDKVTLFILDGALQIEFGESASLFTKTLVDLEPLDFVRVINKTIGNDLGEDGLDALAPIPDAFDAAMNRALLVLSAEVDKATEIKVGDGVLRLHSSSSMGDSDESMEYDTRIDPPPPFHVDPALLARGAKVCATIGFLSRAVVLADSDGKFVHIVTHVTK